MEMIQEFPVPTDELWDAIADADQLGAWLGDELEVDLRPGGQGRLVDDGEVRRLVVEEVTPGERLSFTWWPETPTVPGRRPRWSSWWSPHRPAVASSCGSGHR
ncbi:MAG: SRPBCC domain-containing protein [Acidimicrobiales bacterium]